MGDFGINIAPQLGGWGVKITYAIVPLSRCAVAPLCR
jgi:hypothetical protein